MSRPRRIGLLGGTFDPIHLGHLALATAARTALTLDEVRVVPSRVPPHRPQPGASVYHRFAMAALAATGDPQLVLDDIEAQDPDRCVHGSHAAAPACVRTHRAADFLHRRR